MTAPAVTQCKPRIRLGVVGARDLKGGQDWLAQQFALLWRVSAGQEVIEFADAHCLRLTTGMADGADRLAISSYLAWRGGRSDELLLVYPCAVADFRARSGIEDLKGFDETRAQTEQLATELVLDGAMPRTAKPSPDVDAREKRIRAAAHRYQSEVLIRQCEFLVAVIDRSEQGASGGTRETIARAVDLDTPVLVLDPATRSAFVLGQLEELRPDFVPGTDWATRWFDVIRSTVAPRQSVDRHGKPLGIESVYAEWENPEVLTRWDAFQAPFVESIKAHRKKLADWFVGSGGRSSGQTRPEPETPSAWAVLRLVVRAARGVLRARPKKLKPRKSAILIETWRGTVADRQSVTMSEYRSLFLSNYGLALTAVFLALISLAALALSLLKPAPGLLWLILVLTGIKFWIVRQIARNTHRAEHMDAGEVAVGLRYVAERLRPIPKLMAVGSARIDLVHQTPRRGRPHQIAEDLCRRLPLKTLIVSHDSKSALAGLIAFIDEQLGHHLGTHTAMDTIRSVLERAVALSGKTVIAVVGADLIVLLLKIWLKSPFACVFPSAWVDPMSSVLSIVGVVLVFLTALLPALMATLNGILFQSQAEQLADRHGAMVDALARLRDDARSLQQQLASGSFETSGSQAVLTLTERTVRLMAEEVGEWATMYNQGVKEQ